MVFISSFTKGGGAVADAYITPSMCIPNSVGEVPEGGFGN